MTHFIAKRAMLIFTILLHLWWGLILVSPEYPPPYGWLEFWVAAYGAVPFGLALILGALLTAVGVFIVYWGSWSRQWAITWCLPQQYLLVHMALGQLAGALMEGHGTTGMRALGLLIPAAILHAAVLIDIYQQRDLEHTRRQRRESIRRGHASAGSGVA